MKTLNKWQEWLFEGGAILILAGAVLMATPWKSLAPYVYGLGALGFAPMQMLARYEGDNLILKRLRRQQLAGAVLLLLTAIPMFMNVWNTGFARRNEWILCLAVAAWLQLYAAFRIASELKKRPSRR